MEDLHYDNKDNLHLVAVGRKYWRLFPPSSVCCRIKYPRVGSCLRHPDELPYAGRDVRRKLRGGPSMAVGPHPGGETVVLDAGDALWLPGLIIQGVPGVPWDPFAPP